MLLEVVEDCRLMTNLPCSLLPQARVWVAQNVEGGSSGLTENTIHSSEDLLVLTPNTEPSWDSHRQWFAWPNLLASWETQHRNTIGNTAKVLLQDNERHDLLKADNLCLPLNTSSIPCCIFSSDPLVCFRLLSVSLVRFSSFCSMSHSLSTYIYVYISLSLL